MRVGGYLCIRARNALPREKFRKEPAKAGESGCFLRLREAVTDTIAHFQERQNGTDDQ